MEAVAPTEADEDAGAAGLPFMQTEHEDEHEDWGATAHVVKVNTEY